MAETLGSLCDKLTIELKEWHSEKQPERMLSLATQEQQLREEIDALIADAASGRIPLERLTFAANKVYRKEGNAVPEVTGSMHGWRLRWRRLLESGDFDTSPNAK